MGEKRKKIYEALVDGATEGHSGSDLYNFVQKRCPKTSGKKIVRASLLALTDPHVKDRNVLDVIYALAIKHRMDEVRPGEDHGDDDDVNTPAPSVEKTKKKKTAPIENDGAHPET
ncbi:hypothetical protein CN085_27665 [Sinorhizobium meliloti]|uniref:hypothetical protein n=1 Tax=Rhizobium meliloti TaxID=382 RepID=UPI000FD77C56|nr:hypothetical protein [Sinorhizobium meliloti]RVP09925.1 hypothetical protein CN085_27665 [Sinorhizobium meliloti]